MRQGLLSLPPTVLGDWTQVYSGATIIGRPATYAGTGVTHTIEITSDTTEGNSLLLAIKTNEGAAVSKVEDSEGNTWTIDESSTNVIHARAFIARAPLTKALLGSDTITVTLASSAELQLGAFEYPGLLASPADVNAQASGTGTAAAAGPTGTTAQANELSVSVIGSSATLTGATPPTGYTLRETGKGVSGAVEMADKLLTAKGTETPAWTITSGNWAVVAQTYKAEASGLTNAYVSASSVKPLTVAFNGVPLTAGASTQPGTNKWFWTGGNLYIDLGGTNPETGVVTVTYPALLFEGSAKTDFWHLTQPWLTTEVTDPIGGVNTVLKMVVSDTDITPFNTNPEANANTPQILEPGKEYWASGSWLLSSSGMPSPIGSEQWLEVMEIYGEPFGGPPPFHITYTHSGGMDTMGIPRPYNGYDMPWSAVPVYDKWVNYLLHFKFAKAGWIEMWINGIQITFFNPSQPVVINPSKIAPTTKLETALIETGVNDGANNNLETQNYHEKTLGTTTVYHGPVKIGLTQASVGG